MGIPVKGSGGWPLAVQTGERVGGILIPTALVEKGPLMDLELLQRLRPRHTRGAMTACSLCLHVRRGSQWVEAERVIREIRSFEHENPPRLIWTVCKPCSESIFGRRADAEKQMK